jgi:hypothetical protein
MTPLYSLARVPGHFEEIKMRRAAAKRSTTAAPETRCSKRRAALTVAAAALAPSVAAKSVASSAAPAQHLFGLGDGLVLASVVQRPSARNKSPYVGDVRLGDGRVAIAHMPSME